MTATAALPVIVGNGTRVHIGHDMAGDGSLFTSCGAEGRGPRQSRIRLAAEGTEVTCPRCLKTRRAEAPAEAPAALNTEEDLEATPDTELEAEEPTAEVARNREEWLTKAVAALKPLFLDAGAELPTVRVSVGWPGGRGSKANVIGQCWARRVSADKVNEVFISPRLADPAQVLETLVHELVHAWDDCASGHKGAFTKLARKLGLAGKLTATHAGDELKAQLEEVAKTLGTYPHGAMVAGAEGADGPKKQGTRMLKVACPIDGYTIRTTAKWLEVGVPTCPCGALMERAA